MARPSRLKKEKNLGAKFAAVLRAGESQIDACRRFDVPFATYKDWLRWGTRVDGEHIVAEEPYRSFAKAVNDALTAYKEDILGELTKQGRDATWKASGAALKDGKGNVVIPAHKKGDIIVAPNGRIARPGKWGANAWLLERRFPKEFAPQVRVLYESQMNRGFDALARELEPETFARVLEIWSRAGDELEDPLGGGTGAPPAGASPGNGSGSSTRH
jgi:hypothetical protein